MNRDLLPLTAAGLLVSGLGVVGYIAGWTLGWVELMVVAAGCILALASAAPFVIGRIKLDVARTLQPARVMVGETSVAVLDIVNPGTAPIRPRIIEDAVADKHVRVEVPGLSGGDRHQTVYNLPTAARGVIKVGPAVVARQDPLHLMRREVRQADADTLWVHPKFLPLPPLPVGFAKDLEGPTSETSPAGDVAFHALREYQPGDDFRHIHWMSTARANKPMVRHYVDNRRPQLTVVIDDRASSLPPEQFEVAMQVAASLGVSAMLHQQPISLWTTAGPMVGRTKPGGRDDVLDRLTLAKPVQQGDPTKTSMTAIRTEVGTSALVLVTGPLDPSELVLLASQAKRHARVIIVRIWPDEVLRPGVVPGAKVVDIESLEHFSRAWQRIAR